MKENKKTKLVFSKNKFLIWHLRYNGKEAYEYYKKNHLKPHWWVNRFNGRTPEEMNEHGFCCSKIWCIEVEC